MATDSKLTSNEHIILPIITKWITDMHLDNTHYIYILPAIIQNGGM